MGPKSLEREIIDYLKHYFCRSSSHIVKGIGDDAACLTDLEEVVVACDVLYEDVHFRIDDQDSLFLVGKKAFLVNISDLLAKGVLAPYYFVLGLGIPLSYTLQDVKKVLSGMKEVLEQYDSYLVGGDVFRCDKLCLSVTVLGHKVSDTPWLSRSGLEVGDTLYLTGPLGLSSAGLFLQEKKKRHPLEERFRQAHYAPSLPYHVVQTMHRLGRFPVASVDLSDSFIETLELMGSKDYTLSIQGEKLIPQSVKTFFEDQKIDPAQSVFSCGEDYQLLLAFREEPPPEMELLFAGKVLSYQGRPFIITWHGSERTDEFNNYFKHFS